LESWRCDIDIGRLICVAAITRAVTSARLRGVLLH